MQTQIKKWGNSQGVIKIEKLPVSNKNCVIL